MYKGFRMLVMILLFVVGTAPVAFARGGSHGGFHGGDFGHGGFPSGGMRHGGGFGHGGFSNGGMRHGGFHDGFHGGHVGLFHHPHFHGGIVLEAPPLWIAPEPYIDVTPDIGVTPAPTPMWYYCPNPPGYYPTVPACHELWIPVYPQP
jgi:hypothetical protein